MGKNSKKPIEEALERFTYSLEPLPIQSEYKGIFFSTLLDIFVAKYPEFATESRTYIASSLGRYFAQAKFESCLLPRKYVKVHFKAEKENARNIFLTEDDFLNTNFMKKQRKKAQEKALITKDCSIIDTSTNQDCGNIAALSVQNYAVVTQSTQEGALMSQNCLSTTQDYNITQTSPNDQDYTATTPMIQNNASPKSQDYTCITQDCTNAPLTQDCTVTPMAVEVVSNVESSVEFQNDDSSYDCMISPNIDAQIQSSISTRKRKHQKNTTSNIQNRIETRYFLHQTSITAAPLSPPNLATLPQIKITKELELAPDHIKILLNNLPIKKQGIDLSQTPPLYMTSNRKQVLAENGFVEIPNVIHPALLSELIRYIKLKLKSEHIEEGTYLVLGKANNNIGLLTRTGWTKFDYNGPVQQLLSSSPNLYLCIAEALGHARLATNLYEYKVCPPEKKIKKPLKSGLPHFEFTHTDGNYKKLLLAKAAGAPLNDVQTIIALTPMKKGSTVYFAKGFHKVWEALTYRNFKKKSTRGWLTVDPTNGIFSQAEVKHYIEDCWTPAEVDAGGIVIFYDTIPHGPDLNYSGSTRMAGYVYYAPLISIQNEEAPADALTYLPNTLKQVRNDILTGNCPEKAAHPWTSYPLSDLSKKFYSTLPYKELPRSLLADCIFGFKPWADFERSKEGQFLYGLINCSQEQRLHHINEMNESSISALASLNCSIEKDIMEHEKHIDNLDKSCSLCCRIDNASLSEWWHSIDAAFHFHKEEPCECKRCCKARKLGWRFWGDVNGCICDRCPELK